MEGRPSTYNILMIRKKVNRQKKKRLLCLLGILAGGGLWLWLSLWFWLLSAHRELYTPPPKERINLAGVLERAEAGELTTSDYQLLFQQTGLGPSAIADLQKEEDFSRQLLRYQDCFFQERDLICRRVFFPVWQEWLITPEEEPLQFLLAPCQAGDILLTRSTHCLGWRMGHAGLVVDPARGLVLESSGLGFPSALEELSHWQDYPSFILLRLKDRSKEERAAVAAFAQANLLDVPYRLTAGLWGEKLPWQAKERAAALGGEQTAAAPADEAVLVNPDQKRKDTSLLGGTQCAHLIWSAFAAAGYDIDSDGGWLVTPRDLARSPLLEVVQVYGVDPRKPWP